MDTKLLKQKILDLAIRGKLVPQNPADEPASVLLERIKAEKAQLIKEGKIKKEKPLPPIEEVPFEIPKSWEWCRLGSISNYGECINVSTSNISPDSWVLELEDIEKDSARVLYKLRFCDREIKGVRHQFVKGQILYSKLRTYLNKVLVAKDNGFCTTEIIPFSVILNDSYYICHVMRSPYFLDYTNILGFGVKMPRLSTTDAQNALIPIPPLEEQKRIVAEIDRWFKCIDELEKNQQDLHTAIQQAKSKILDLAIHGKLVPQDFYDKNDDKETDDGPFRLPNSWSWMSGTRIFQPMKSVKPSGETFKYIDIDSIDNRNYRIKSPKIIPTGEAPSRASRHTEVGDVIFSMVRPYLKNIALVEENDCIASSGFYVCKPCSFLNSKYCYYLMLSNYVVDGINQFMKGDNSPSINKRDIENWLYPIPPLEEQKIIVTKMEELFAQLDKIEESLN